MNRDRRHSFLIVAVLIAIHAAAFPTIAQSGGGFEITEAVVAGGGGSSANGDIQIDATAGQAIATGPIGAGIFGLTSGFWNFIPLGPTAAHVSISGRVVDPSGTGVSSAVLYMHTQEGDLRVTRTSSFGYFQFNDVAAGQAVLISVQARRYTYAPRTVIVADDVTDIEFVPEPSQSGSDPNYNL